MVQTVAYKITGGKPVKGEITCLGAKNFATKAMVASCLTEGVTRLTNAPRIDDVEITAELLRSIGVKVEWISETELEIDPSDMNTSKVKTPDSRNNRIPILLIPILLHRFAKASVPSMGGCDIGERKVDFHTTAAEQFGAKVICDMSGYKATVENRLQGTHFDLEYPSVGATETCLFLSVLAEGTSVITNAAIEPEIIELITMLRSMGAIIFSEPNREIRIEGVETLHGTVMQILGDRIEAASWASLACASDGDITVNGIKANTLGNYLSYFQQVGGGYEFLGPESIRFFKASSLKPTMIETDVYPGFSTDWQQPFAILLTQADGMSAVHETVYESRFGYMKTLNKLGAKTQLTTQCLGKKCRFADHNHRHSALIMGKTPLKAIEEPIQIPDLRAGLAYVIAAAIADGTTLLTGVELLERGYGDICTRLQGISLEVERVKLGKKDVENWFSKVVHLKSHRLVS
jgi:UDP-N-acetylglucosamine 1-carboxyvinyltransferase